MGNRIQSDSIPTPKTPTPTAPDVKAKPKIRTIDGKYSAGDKSYILSKLPKCLSKFGEIDTDGDGVLSAAEICDYRDIEIAQLKKSWLSDPKLTEEKRSRLVSKISELEMETYINRPLKLNRKY